MNIENIRRVRDQIAADPTRFNMAELVDLETQDVPRINECGTAACIAGWAASLAGWKAPERDNPFDTYRSLVATASDFLGLGPVTEWDFSTPADNQAAAELFFIGSAEDVYLEDITAEQAIATLDRLIETGEVQWML